MCGPVLTPCPYLIPIPATAQETARGGHTLITPTPFTPCTPPCPGVPWWRPWAIRAHHWTGQADAWRVKGGGGGCEHGGGGAVAVGPGRRGAGGSTPESLAINQRWSLPSRTLVDKLYFRFQRGEATAHIVPAVPQGTMTRPHAVPMLSRNAPSGATTDWI